MRSTWHNLLAQTFPIKSTAISNALITSPSYDQSFHHIPVLKSYRDVMEKLKPSAPKKEQPSPW